MKVRKIKSLIEAKKILKCGGKIFCESDDRYLQQTFDFSKKSRFETKLQIERDNLRDLVRRIDQMTDDDIVSSLKKITASIKNKL